jgi:hypothetical protein
VGHDNRDAARWARNVRSGAGGPSHESPVGRSCQGRETNRLVLIAAVLISGCCVRPSSPYDQSVVVARDVLPSVVVVVNRDRGVGGCVGTVIGVVPNAPGFDAYVLTAKHCVIDAKGRLARVGVALPAPSDEVLAIRSPVFDATVAYLASEDDRSTDGTVVWESGDWAILRVQAPTSWPVASLYPDDPEQALEPGERVSLLAYMDKEYRDPRPMLKPHEHPFRWTGVPADIEQWGHSGAPVVRNGEVFAIFSGATQNSYGCRLICGTHWPTKLRFVSVTAIRAQAARQGFDLFSK